MIETWNLKLRKLKNHKKIISVFITDKFSLFEKNGNTEK